MNSIKIPTSNIIPKYLLTNGGSVIREYLGKNEKGEEKYKDLPVHHVGPDGVLCSDELETFVSWDRLGAK